MTHATPVGETDVVARMPDYPELPNTGPGSSNHSLEHLLDVGVTVTAELGRVSRSISDVLKLGVGSVLELDRSVTEPVDLLVQGTKLARGEVVVVDDRFAVRITEIVDAKKRS